jgi:hypothetical protein
MLSSSKRREVKIARIRVIEFFCVGTVRSAHDAVELRRMRGQDKQPNSALGTVRNAEYICKMTIWKQKHIDGYHRNDITVLFHGFCDLFMNMSAMLRTNPGDN